MSKKTIVAFAIVGVAVITGVTLFFSLYRGQARRIVIK